MLKTVPFLLFSIFILTGCVDRGAADEKLALGCLAGAELFVEEGYKIVDPRNKKFRDALGLGKGYREVTIDVTETDDWYEGDATIQCLFVEEIGFFGRHVATIYQLRLSDDEVYGKEGTKIMGSFQDHLRLTETVEQAMNP